MLPQLSRLLQLSGIPRIRGREALVLAFLIDALGTGLYQPFSLLYFQKIVQLDLPAIGVALTVATILTLPMNPITGSLVDRFGARQFVVISQLLQAIGFLGYLFVRTIPLLFAMAFLVTAGNRIFYAAATTLIAEVAGHDERDRWFGFVGATQNIGLIVGGLLAGLIVTFGGSNGYRALILANVCSFLLMALALCWRRDAHQSNNQVEDLPRDRVEGLPDDSLRGSALADERIGYRAVLADRPFLVLVACNVVFALCSLMMSLGLPIYATETLKLSTATVGALFAFNSLLVICTQTVTVRFLESFRRTRSLLVACLLWIAGCMLFALAPLIPSILLIPYLFGTVAIYTFAGMIAGTISAALAAASSPAHTLGRYMALFELAWGIAGAIAPAMFAWLNVAGPSRTWIALIGPMLIVGPLLLWLEAHLSVRALYVRRSVEMRSGKQVARRTLRAPR
ncbi:MFS transporter [Ktedonobacter robiniae]|uniref:MFS transporter n=1 Tax=Ktedonobacter robiniae TaxID=2778365 RepID=A0ABQ3UG74_9CHLR|nr:MFS transporter [Ktedonobacter robiniae]GHO51720.1 MFS transporter [Ktedonobacter robiniae]